MKDPSDTECLSAELSAAADLTSFWDTAINPAVWISVCLVVAVGINALGVGKQSLGNFFSFPHNPP